MKIFFHFFTFYIFFALIIVLSGCDNNDQPGYWKNAKIKSSKQQELHELSNNVMALLKADNSKKLENMLSRELLENTYTIRKEELLSNQLKANGYELMDEFYIINKYRDVDTVKNKDRAINSYTLEYAGVTKEMYIAMYVPKTGINKFMITIVYAKYDYGWRINKFDLEAYTINNKTAPELYSLAIKRLGKNYLMDAKNTLELASSCLSPNSMWHYTDEKEINSETENITNLTNRQYRMPGVISTIKTKPVVFSIVNKPTPEGTFPAVYYLSKINLSDTVAIKHENEEVKKAIGKIIPGIDKDKAYIFYYAFNHFPNTKTTVDRYEVKQKIH